MRVHLHVRVCARGRVRGRQENTLDFRALGFKVTSGEFVLQPSAMNMHDQNYMLSIINLPSLPFAKDRFERAEREGDKCGAARSCRLSG